MPEPLLTEVRSAFQTHAAPEDGFRFSIEGDGALPSWFGVTDLAVASIGMAGAALAQLLASGAAEPPAVSVDRRLASLWFQRSLHPIGRTLPPVWDQIAGDYRTNTGCIRLHTNARHHRAAVLSVLGQPEDRDAVEAAVAGWDGGALEAAVVDAGGCAAVMHSLNAWQRHPQGAAVATEPLVIFDDYEPGTHHQVGVDDKRPLGGVRVLDLTRVLAGPIATRFLAAFGADVLRLDPPDWEEPAVVPETTLGKRCGGLNLLNKNDRATFERLLAEADVLVHGYRPGALDGLGFDRAARRALNPGLIDVSLNAYGWSGPWSDRRGFDSLVQMSSGIADFGMRQSTADQPVPLPVQALDHATGYLMAAAVLRALASRRRQGKVMSARLSLARTAHLLAATRTASPGGCLSALADHDLDPHIEETVWGPARRTRFPLQIEGVEPAWSCPAGPLRTAPAVWLARP